MFGGLEPQDKIDSADKLLLQYNCQGPIRRQAFTDQRKAPKLGSLGANQILFYI